MNEKTIDKVASTSLLMLAVLVCSSVFLRYFFNWPIPDTLDLSRILLGITVLWGITLTIVRDTHIQVDLLWDHLGARSRRILTLFNRILMLLFAVLFAWLVVEHVWLMLQSGKQTVDYRLPLWVFYLVFLPTGVVVLYASVKQLSNELGHTQSDE